MTLSFDSWIVKIAIVLGLVAAREFVRLFVKDVLDPLRSGDGIEEAGEDDADAKSQAKAERRKKAEAKAEEGLGV